MLLDDIYTGEYKNYFSNQITHGNLHGWNEISQSNYFGASRAGTLRHVTQSEELNARVHIHFRLQTEVCSLPLPIHPQSGINAHTTIIHLMLMMRFPSSVSLYLHFHSPSFSPSHWQSVRDSSFRLSNQKNIIQVSFLVLSTEQKKVKWIEPKMEKTLNGFFLCVQGYTRWQWESLHPYLNI